MVRSSKVFSLILGLSAIVFMSCDKGSTRSLLDRQGIPRDTIKVDFGNYELKASELISEYEILYLNSGELLIGTISRLYIFDSFIIVADVPNERIYRFDREGDLEFYIEKPGYGPEEYSQMKDVGVNLSDSTIEVLDLPAQSVVKYDLKSGDFIDKVRYNFYTSTFSPLNDGGRLFHHGTIPNYETAPKGDSLDAGVYLTNARNEVQRVYFNRAELGFDNVRLITRRNAYPNFAYKTNYVPLYQNTIYEASLKGLIPQYYIDFGKSNLPERFLLTFKGHYNDFPQFLDDSKYANSISHVYESSTHLTFTFHSAKGYQKSVYDKKTKKSRTYRKFIRDQSLINIVPRAVYKDYHISVASYESLDLRKRFFERAMSEEKRAGIAEYQRLKEALDNNHGQNPILVFTRFKAIE